MAGETKKNKIGKGKREGEEGQRKLRWMGEKNNEASGSGNVKINKGGTGSRIKKEVSFKDKDEGVLLFMEEVRGVNNSKE